MACSTSCSRCRRARRSTSSSSPSTWTRSSPAFPEHILPEYLTKLGIPFHIENQDTYSIVKDKIPEGKTMCSLCSRLRRGILYRVADELGATKIALGHHRDDMLQTFFLNMFFGGKLKGMPPKLVSDDGATSSSARWPTWPRSDLIRWAEHRQFPIIPCTLCGSQENLQRQQVGEHAARLGEAPPRPHREHVHRAAERRALAPDGPQGGPGRLSFGLGMGRGGFGLGLGGPLYDSSVPLYISEASVLMRDLQTGQIVYDSRARHDGPWHDTENVLAALFVAALQGYPNPPQGVRRVDVPLLPPAAAAPVPAR
jgi:hypothetical protein